MKVGWEPSKRGFAMSRSLVCLTVLAFWAAMTAWVVHRDLLPKFGYGEVRYDTVLGRRLLDERRQWQVLLDGQPVGRATTSFSPEKDGSSKLRTTFSVDTDLVLGHLAPVGAAPASVVPGGDDQRLLVESIVHVGVDRRLQSIEVFANLPSTGISARVAGEVDGQTLSLTSDVTGLGALEKMFDKQVKLAVDPEQLLQNRLGPQDRLPGLSVGRRWTSRVVNPTSALLPSLPAFGSFGRSKGIEVEILRHRVTGVETIRWNGTPVRCFVVVSEHDRTTSKTYVRTADGQVLREELPLLGATLLLELEPGDAVDGVLAM